MRPVRWLFIVLMTLLVGAGAAGALPPVARKLLATGTDSPTPAAFKKHLAEFEKLPFDGTTVVPTRRLAGGLDADCRFAFSREPWQPAELEPMLADLKAAAPKRAKDNFLIICANPGDVDWFDDAGWREITDHWRLLARTAKHGGLRGLCFEAEPCSSPHEQFNHAKQAQRDKKDFAAYAAKARERGREVMQAAAAEFPEMTLLTCRLLSELLPVLSAGSDPTELLLADTYGLMPAFIDGWLDAAPAKLLVVEGNKLAGLRTNHESDFERSYVLLRTGGAGLLAPENRAKYRAQVLIGQSQDLDAYANASGHAPAVGPLAGSPAARFETNATAAVRASDGWLLVYGQAGRWWPIERVKEGEPIPAPWQEKIKGVTEALARAKNPVAAARERLAAANPTENHLKNADFTKATSDGLPDDWWTWQANGSHGVARRDDVGGVATGAWSGAREAVFGQDLPAKPGELFAIGARVKKQGQGTVAVKVGWKDARGESTAPSFEVTLPPNATADSEGWRAINGLVRVPPGAAHLVVQLAAEGQSTPDDRAWFAEAKVVRMRTTDHTD